MKEISGNQNKRNNFWDDYFKIRLIWSDRGTYLGEFSKKNIKPRSPSKKLNMDLLNE